MKCSFIISALFSILTYAAPTPLASNSSLSHFEARTATYRNEVIDGTEKTCKALTVIYARGTWEPGNVGTWVGPPLISRLEMDIGSKNVAAQGVNYEPTMDTFYKGGDKKGAVELARLVVDAISKCPGTQIVLAGYHQGAQVVRLGTEKMGESTLEKVAAVALFHDPKAGEPVKGVDAAKVFTLCKDKLELKCKTLPVIDPSLTLYAGDPIMAKVAAFVREQLNL